MVSLGASCGLSNITDDINELKTKSLDLFTPKMRNLRGGLKALALIKHEISKYVQC